MSWNPFTRFASTTKSCFSHRTTARTTIKPRFDALEERVTPDASYVELAITNFTQLYDAGTGLPNNEINIYFAGQTSTATTAPYYPFAIDSTTGIATQADNFSATTLADIPNGTIKLDRNLVLYGGRLYFSNQTNIISVANNQVTGFPAPNPNPNYYFDFVELALNTAASGDPQYLVIDTTQVDGLGMPITLQVVPNDPLNPDGAGTLGDPSVDAFLTRNKLISLYQQAMNQTINGAQPFLAYLDALIPDDTTDPLSDYYRILSPQNVIQNQLNNPTGNETLYVSIDPGPAPVNAGDPYTATLTILPFAGSSTAPTNGGNLAVGMFASGQFLPAGAVITQLPGSPTGSTIVMSSSTPFTQQSGVTLLFYTAPSTGLNTYFGPAVNSTTNINSGNVIDDFFSYWKSRPNQLLVENSSGGNVVIYTGNVAQVSNVPNMNGGTSTYSVLQFTGGGETYNIYYPYFTTNSPSGKTDPFGNDVPPPPAWWTGLTPYESPSQMVFASNGVFADNGNQDPSTYTGNSTTLGSLENIIGTGLARGVATTWTTSNGAELLSIATPPAGQPPQTAVWQLTSVAGLTVGMNVSSWKVFSIPMTITSIDSANNQITVTTTASFDNVATGLTDLLTFFQPYQEGQTWSAYAQFMHRDDIFIGGRAYALPYDDNGGFSSTLSSLNDASADAPTAEIYLAPWNNPKESFLDRIYQYFLDRLSDSPGFRHWIDQLENPADRVGVALSLVRSNEHFQKTLNEYYEDLLGRAPDAAGVSYFASQFQQGWSYADIRSAILSSDEYFANRGGGTTAGFIAALYQDELGRDVDADGLSYFEVMIDRRRGPRSFVVEQIQQSEEYRSGLIRSWYAAHLNREADAGGLAAWLDALRSGKHEEQILAEILGSGEFYQSKKPSGVS